MGNAQVNPCAGKVLNRAIYDINTLYTFHRQLSSGAYGTVHLVSDNATSAPYACKSIRLARADPRVLHREVEILHHLVGIPGVIQLHSAFEDRDHLHIIMDLCRGGNLLSVVATGGPYPEEKAARMFIEMVKAVRDCHELGVMHGDIKLENFVLLNKREDSPIKLADFGLSDFFKPGQIFKRRPGARAYMAPEILTFSPYEPATDIWCLGVILFLLLFNKLPLPPGIWTRLFYPNVISDKAMDLIERILQLDPKMRISANDILNHPWVRQHGGDSDVSLRDTTIVTRMKRFQAMNMFKRVVLGVIAELIPDEEKSGLKNIFDSMDTDNDGKINFEELIDGLLEWGGEFKLSEVDDFFESMDLNGDGVIKFHDFVSATMHSNLMEKGDRLLSAFLHFDKENRGYITREQVKEALKQYSTRDEEIFEGDGLTFDNFLAMMRMDDTHNV